MDNPFVARVGGTLSADIAVPEHDRELSFFSQILTTGNDPLWREDLMNNRGLPVIGLGARTAEYEGLPLQWMPHIQVASVADSAARAVDLGGTELMHGKSEDGQSPWAVILDPNGAAFGLVPVVPDEFLPPTEPDAPGDNHGTVGCIRWLELRVADPAATRDFYAPVIGWSVQEPDRNNQGEAFPGFLMLGDDRQPAAGIVPSTDGSPNSASVWLIHLPVGNLNQSLKIVEENGGAILEGAATTGCGHTRAVIQDPVGTVLALVQA